MKNLQFVPSTRRVTLLISVALLCHGCGLETGSNGTGEGGEADLFALVDNEHWLVLDEDADPFRDERPEFVDCPPWAHVEENNALEIDTGACNYVSLSQPILTGINAGDTVELSLWHDALVASEPGVAHVALALGEDVIWEIEPNIPSTPHAYRPRIQIIGSYATGTPIVFHLHNHGSNNWRLLTVSVERTLVTPVP